MPVAHLDAYRLGGPDDEEAGSLREAIGEDAIGSWSGPTPSSAALPPPRLEVELRHVGGDRRLVLLDAEADPRADLGRLVADLRARHRHPESEPGPGSGMSRSPSSGWRREPGSGRRVLEAAPRPPRRRRARRAATSTRVVVGVGPGGFTGLRIGLATALGLGQALGVPVTGASSLEALALGIAERPPRARWSPR